MTRPSVITGAKGVLAAHDVPIGAKLLRGLFSLRPPTGVTPYI